MAERLREIIAGEQGVVEKRMFGGLAFMVDGHLAVSASGRSGLLLRVDPAQTDALDGGVAGRSPRPRGSRMELLAGGRHASPPGIRRFGPALRRPIPLIARPFDSSPVVIHQPLSQTG
jgi:hypothetical protein